jgi:UDP-glucuronate 4-epimerase
MTGLRFFTVYGPWGRPDMAYFKFTKNIINGDSIDVFNNGNHARDFTYIDDIVAGVVSSVDRHIDDKNDCKIYNLGNNKPVELMQFIQTLENIIGKKAKLNMLPMQNGDVEKTYADIIVSMNELNYSPNTNIEKGLARFVEWFRDYYKD